MSEHNLSILARCAHVVSTAGADFSDTAGELLDLLDTLSGYRSQLVARELREALLWAVLGGPSMTLDAVQGELAAIKRHLLGE